MSERWWRAKNSAVNNRKLQKLPAELFRSWFNVNCLASANGGVVPPIDDVAYALRLTNQRAAVVLTQLAAAKLLDKQEDGQFVPHDWDEHQFKTDKKDPTAAERMQRHRDKKRNERNVTVVTERNDSNDTVSVKRPEAEAESEANTEQSRADASALIDEDLKRKVAALQAGITALFASRQQTVPSLNRCLLWLTQGYGQGTILGAVEAVLKRGKVVSTLDYFDGAIKDAHAKAPPAANLQVVAQQTFIVEGTLEWNCWEQHLRATTGRGSPVTDNRDEHGRIRRGWYRLTSVPEGYDEATGERLAPPSEDAA